MCSVPSPQPLVQTEHTAGGSVNAQLNEKIGFKETCLRISVQAMISIIRLNHMKLPSSWVKEVEYWPPQMVQPNVRWGHSVPPASFSKQEEEDTPGLVDPTAPPTYIPQSLSPRYGFAELSTSKERNNTTLLIHRFSLESHALPHPRPKQPHGTTAHEQGLSFKMII